MEKIVLIGAGSQNFGLGIISDIFKSDTLDGCEIFLHDIDKTTLANTKIIANDYKEKLGVNVDIKASISRKEAPLIERSLVNRGTTHFSNGNGLVCKVLRP